MQTADKLNKAVGTWQKSDSRTVRIARQKLHLKHYERNQISQWKAQAIAGMADIFERPNKKSEETTVRRVMRRFGITAIFSSLCRW